MLSFWKATDKEAENCLFCPENFSGKCLLESKDIRTNMSCLHPSSAVGSIAKHGIWLNSILENIDRCG